MSSTGIKDDLFFLSVEYNSIQKKRAPYSVKDALAQVQMPNLFRKNVGGWWVVGVCGDEG